MSGTRKAATRWVPLEGAGLAKVERMFSTRGLWYSLATKIRGKTVFARDHGVATLYVVGNDDHAYSIKLHGGLGSATQEDLNNLVDASRTGEYDPKSQIYRNMKISSGRQLLDTKRLRELLAEEKLLRRAGMNQYGEIDRDEFPPGHKGGDTVEVRIQEKRSGRDITKLRLKMSDLKELDDFLEKVYFFFAEKPDLSSAKSKNKLKSLEQAARKFNLPLDHWTKGGDATAVINVKDKFGNEWTFNVDGWQAQFDPGKIKSASKDDSSSKTAKFGPLMFSERGVNLVAYGGEYGSLVEINKKSVDFNSNEDALQFLASMKRWVEIAERAFKAEKNFAPGRKSTIERKTASYMSELHLLLTDAQEERGRKPLTVEWLKEWNKKRPHDRMTDRVDKWLDHTTDSEIQAFFRG